MVMQIVGLWIGLAITFVLGLVNFLWGPAILARRQKVIIRDAEVKVSVVEKPQQETPDLTKTERICIHSNFKLVRIRGMQDLYLESAYLQLSKARCEKLEPYFVIPSENRIYWGYRSYMGVDEAEYRTMKFNEPREFKIYANFDPRSSLRKLENALQQTGNDEELEEKRAMLKDLKEMAKKLETKYMIVWKDGGGKEWQYRLPEKFWHKFLPEWLWWKIG